MAEIKEFVQRPKTAKTADGKGLPNDAATIVIFPGVRYERAETDTTSQRKLRERELVSPEQVAVDRDGA